MLNFISYYRVSIQKQGRSGLGLEGQRADVERYIAGKGVILEEYAEIESGRKNNRTQLHKAIQKATEVNINCSKIGQPQQRCGFYHPAIQQLGKLCLCGQSPYQ